MSAGTNLCAGCGENQANGNGYCSQCNEIEREAERSLTVDVKTLPLFRCPFCGEPPQRHYVNPDSMCKCFWVQCGNPKCGAQGATAKDPKEAIDKWNRRTFYQNGGTQ